VLAAISEKQDYPTEKRWFAEGRAKDTPEIRPSAVAAHRHHR